MFKFLVLILCFCIISCSDNSKEFKTNPNQLIQQKIDSVDSEKELSLLNSSRLSYSNDPIDEYFNKAIENNYELKNLISHSTDLITESSGLDTKLNSYKNKMDELETYSNYLLNKVNNKEIRKIMEDRLTKYSNVNKSLFNNSKNEIMKSDSLRSLIADGIAAIKLLYALNYAESDMNIYKDFEKFIKTSNDSLARVNVKLQKEIKKANK